MTPYVWLLLLSSLATAASLFYAWRNRRAAGSTLLLVALLFVLVWLSINLLELIGASSLLADSFVPAAEAISRLIGIDAPFALDPTPLFLGIAALVLTWAHRRYRLFAIVPLARDAVVEGLGDAVVVIDARGRIVDLNAAAKTVLGAASGPILGTQAVLALKRWPTIAGLCQGTEQRTELVRSDDGQSYFEVQVSPLRGGKDRLVGQVITLRDVSERQHVSEALRESERRYREMADSLPETVFEIDAAGRLIFANRAGFLQFGYSEQDMKEEVDSLHQLVAPQDGARLTGNMAAILAGESREAHEYAMLRKDGTAFPGVVCASRVLRDGAPVGIRGFILDISARKQHEQQLSYLATHDPLTGLPNRRSLEDTLERVAARARRGTPSALLYMDVDNFKHVNDSMGHSAGDRALVTMSRMLQDCLRSGDLLARLGGDELAVLLEGTALEDAREVADRLRRTVAAFTFDFDGLKFNLGLSVGLVDVDAQYPPSVLLAEADAAMYRAKELGGNCVVVCRLATTDGAGELPEANRLAARLRDALREGFFVLHYQPVVRLSNGAVDHHEALLRLLAGDGTLLPPPLFLPTAERLGLMPQLTRWVVREAVSVLKRVPSLRLSLNISTLDISDERLPDLVASTLAEQAVEPVRLAFEVTEMAILRNPVLAERWIRPLKALGCRFALDNFGAGFASLFHLRDLPVDQFKIDGAFMDALDADPSQRAFVQAMQSLAAARGKETIAGRVERAETVGILKALGVDCAQGYYFGKPLAEADLIDRGRQGLDRGSLQGA